MEAEFVRQRITELRIKRGISEYKMSLDLGHSRSYIQSITSGRALPSLAELLYICEYLGVTPASFFNAEVQEPILLERAITGMRALSDEDMIMLIRLIERLGKDTLKEQD